MEFDAIHTEAGRFISPVADRPVRTLYSEFRTAKNLGP
jgi:hypothetical protein